MRHESLDQLSDSEAIQHEVNREAIRKERSDVMSRRRIEASVASAISRSDITQHFVLFVSCTFLKVP